MDTSNTSVDLKKPKRRVMAYLKQGEFDLLMEVFTKRKEEGKTIDRSRLVGEAINLLHYEEFVALSNKPTKIKEPPVVKRRGIKDLFKKIGVC